MLPQLVLHLHKELEKKRSPLHKANEPYAVYEKHDGNYVYFDWCGSNLLELHSRQGNPVVSLTGHSKHLFAFISAITPYLPTRGRAIFEVTIPGMGFHKANGLINRHVGAYQLSFEGVMYHWHDLIDRSRLFEGFERRFLEPMFDKISHDPNVEICQPRLITNQHEKFVEQAKLLWDKGKEGVVAKLIKAPYEPGKRNLSLLKVKQEEKAVGLFRGFETTYGDKGFEGMVILLDVDGIETTVNVGADLDKELVKTWYKELDGKPIKLTSMCKLPSGKLREPRLASQLNVQFSLDNLLCLKPR